MSRRAELAANLEAVRRRIRAAAEAAARDPSEVTLVAVTKTFPASDIALLADLGVTDIGENRDQEARAKLAELAGVDVRWHFVGQVQRNKARSVASYADLVHSVDNADLVAALSAGATRAQREVPALVQVDFDEPPSPDRGGVPPAAVAALAADIARADGLEFRGVMTVAPLGTGPAEVFEQLVEICAALRADHPQGTIVSAGMSGDLEQAVRAGATHVRVGTALLGRRPTRFG